MLSIYPVQSSTFAIPSHPMNPSLQSLIANDITSWWSKVGKYRLARLNKNYILKSGNLVDVYLHSRESMGCIFLRYSRITKKYNNLWRSVVAPLDTRQDIFWWLVTSDEYEFQDEDVSIEIFRTKEAYDAENEVR